MQRAFADTPDGQIHYRAAGDGPAVLLLHQNVHIHSLVLDGVFTRSAPTVAPVFHALTAPTDAEVAEVLDQIYSRVRRLLRRRGRVPEEESSPSDPVAEQMPLLAEYASASIQGLVASGPRAGHPVRRLRSAAAVVDEAKPRCARLKGFSLHANVGVPAHARARLEHLCRYLLRPPLPLERLTESSHGQLVFELPHPRTDGATHLLLDPLELIEKVAILIPPPRFHTLRFHGLLAPHAGWRSLIVPRPAEGAGQAGRGPEAGESTLPGTGSPRPAPEPGRQSWAALLRRVFALDVFHCPRCGGRRRIVGVHTGGEGLRVLLERVAIRGPVALAAAAGSLTEQDTALCMERSIEMVVAIFGVLQAGAASVPLDPGYIVGA